MHNRKRLAAVRAVAVILAVALVLPMGAAAAVVQPVQPCASYYLDSYNAYVYPAGNGKVQVYFSVFGVNYMDELGALSIQIYESTNEMDWTWVKTYTHDSTEGMLDYNDVYHSGHVDYQGVAGRYYAAYVCIWAGKNGDGDNRYFWTASELAT